MNRALRRHHRERLKKTRAKYWAYPRGDDPMPPRILGKVVSTPHPCSCWMCCNERRIDGLSIAERRLGKD